MTQMAATQASQDTADGNAAHTATGRAALTTLDSLANGEARIVRAVRAPDNAPEWTQLLEEIGFIAGERVTVMARGLPGGDPLVVRVGLSTFALRRAEAACVHVALD